MERIIVKNVSKNFKIGFAKKQSPVLKFISGISGREPKKNFEVLKNISFSAKPGERVGIIGKNGAGKSTLLRIIAGIYEADAGTIETNGKILPFIDGMLMFDRLTMKDNIYIYCSLFGLNQKTIEKKFDSIVEFSGLEKFVNTKLYQFSLGMTARILLSIAVHCNSDIILFDDGPKGSDKQFKKRLDDRIHELLKNKVTFLLVSHDMEIIKKNSDRAIWLEKGKIIKEGDPEDVIEAYKSFNL